MVIDVEGAELEVMCGCDRALADPRWNASSLRPTMNCCALETGIPFCQSFAVPG